MNGVGSICALRFGDERPTMEGWFLFTPTWSQHPKIWKQSTATARLTVVHCDAVAEHVNSIVLRHVENARFAML
jgi:hypothetical protein